MTDSIANDDLAARLQAAVGEGFTIGEELPASGGSRSFVATEVASGAPIVVRVLSADVSAAADVAHFRTAMGAVANTTHPYIVPMLAAGTAPGMLFYLMPRLAGESLRQRLDRKPPLSVSEAAQILFEVCEAVQHAHSAGIMHGDIRPEHVILEAQWARLAGIGVAAAIRPAKGATITTRDHAGDAGGYIAPEILREHEPHDARSDVFSLGVLAYETFSGRRPYTSDAQLLATGPLAADPPRLASVRKEIARPVSDAVARAMARDRAQRFRGPAELALVFRRAAKQASPLVRRTLYTVGTLAAVTVIGLTVRSAVRSRGIDENLIAVAPFTVPAALEVWREGLVDMVSANLDGIGELRTVPAGAALHGWREAGEPDHAKVAAFAKRMGARRGLYGRIVPGTADTLQVTAYIVDALSGRATLFFEFKSLPSRMPLVAAGLGQRTLTGLITDKKPPAARLSSFGTQSLAALESFFRGERFFRQSEYDSARVYYRKALAADTGFVVAMARLWRVAARAGLTNDANFRESEAAGRRATRLNKGLAPLESLTVLRDSLTFEMLDAPSQRTLDRLKEVVEVSILLNPKAPEVWMLAAEERSGFLRHVGATHFEVLQASERGIGLDSAYSPVYLTAFNSAWEAYGWAQAQPYLEALLRHRPKSVEARGLTLLRRVHDSPVAEDSAIPLDTIAGEAITLAMSYAALVQDSTNTALRLARLRIRHPLPLEAQDRAIVSATLLSRGHWREARRIGGIAAVAGELPLAPAFSADSVVAWSRAWAADARDGDVIWRPHALLWRAAELKRADLLREIGLGAQEVARSSATRESRYVIALSQALVPIATTSDTTAVLTYLQQIGESQCFLGCYPMRVAIARSLNSRGANAVARDLLGSGDGAFSGLQFWAMPLTRTLWRLERARAAEASNAAGQALLDYQAVITTLKDADPELQPVVDAAREGLKRLGK